MVIALVTLLEEGSSCSGDSRLSVSANLPLSLFASVFLCLPLCMSASLFLPHCVSACLPLGFCLTVCLCLSYSFSDSLSAPGEYRSSTMPLYTHTIAHSHNHTLLITCTCCYDQTKGTQDKDFSYSFSDSLSAPQTPIQTNNLFRYLQKRTLSADGDSYSKLDNSFGDGLVENASNDGPTRMGEYSLHLCLSVCRTHNHILTYPLSLVLVMTRSKEFKTSRSLLMMIL